MVAMAWGCESHARSLGHRTMTFYGGETAIDRRRRERTATARAGRDAMCCALRPGALDPGPDRVIAYADHVRQDTGINWLGALGGAGRSLDGVDPRRRHRRRCASEGLGRAPGALAG